ncbi:hypothetical protein [Mycolicibacterium moriokaense]|uniref:hypothetical protein n=1 Tax=Mycolicibacterium moriokaense TaxID=39691 RepID=UPI0010542ED0|nr:hypothetical protein [Mycolicibacterium moriokaense]MCV7038967.1 hypothetical protein [Mycolicibacterium moriokaense]
MPEALQHEPVPEDAGIGGEPGIEIVISDPGGDLRLESPNDSSEPGHDGATVDEPVIGFEIPPDITDAEIRNMLGDDLIGKLHRLHEIRGVDALGWYVSFHQLGCQYGIYIRFEAVVWLALEFLQDVQVPLDRKLELAVQAILRHEIFHFEVDCMIANWELATGVEVYWSSRKHRNAAGYIELEEGLANAYMLRGFKYPTRLLGNAPGAYAALKRFCERQPIGYKDGPRYLRSNSSDLYLRECSQLADDYHGSSAAPWHVPDEFDTLKLYDDVTQIDWTRCPIILQDRYNLQGQLGINISYFRTVERIVETDRFRRALAKLDGTLQRQWEKVKDMLAVTTYGNGARFKRWHAGGDD